MTTIELAAPRVESSAVASVAERARLRIIDETLADVPAREALLDACFGASRRLKSSERLREGRQPARGLALAAHLDGELVGTIRLWHVESESGHAALMLGPVAVAASKQSFGIGGALIREALARARARGHKAIILVGDEPYYRRFGFERRLTVALDMPGPVEAERFLGLELTEGALKDAHGVLRPTGPRAGQTRAQRQKRAVARVARAA